MDFPSGDKRLLASERSQHEMLLLYDAPEGETRQGALVASVICRAIYESVGDAHLEFSHQTCLVLEKRKLSSLLLHDAYRAASAKEAERVLSSFVASYVGEADAALLFHLYDAHPWLKCAVGRLRDFCSPSVRRAGTSIRL